MGACGGRRKRRSCTESVSRVWVFFCGSGGGGGGGGGEGEWAHMQQARPAPARACRQTTPPRRRTRPTRTGLRREEDVATTGTTARRIVNRVSCARHQDPQPRAAEWVRATKRQASGAGPRATEAEVGARQAPSAKQVELVQAPPRKLKSVCATKQTKLVPTVRTLLVHDVLVGVRVVRLVRSNATPRGWASRVR